MCQHPIIIKNRTRRYEEGVTKVFLQVPCGHCADCEKSKQDEWFVRSFFEYERVTSSGGAVWFPTLTYDNEHLPWYRDSNFCDKDHHDGFNIPCFCKKDFVSFRNKLRVNLARAGYRCAGDTALRYFYACEFGGRRKRPHIHALIFIPMRIPAKVMYDCFRRSWCNGMVMYSKRGMMADSVKAAQYTMKYITKDISYFKLNKIQSYIDCLKRLEANSKDIDERDFYHNKLKVFRRCLPHHSQSIGFGIDGVSRMTERMIVENKIPSSMLGVFHTDPTKVSWNFRVPTYYLRKLLYDYDRFHNLYILNDYGKEVCRNVFDKKVDSLVAKYSPFVGRWNDYFNQVTPLLSVVEKGRDIESDKSFLTSVLNDISTVRRYVIYRMVYRDVRIDDSLPYCDYSALERGVVDFYVRQKSGGKVITPLGFNEYDRLRSDPVKTYARFPCFDELEEVAQIFDYYNKVLGDFECEGWMTESYRLSGIYVNYDNFLTTEFLNT